MTLSLARRADEAGICAICNGTTVRMAVEQIEDLAYIPMWRTSKMVAQCAQCVRTSVTRLPPGLAAKLGLPKSPRVLPRIVTTWLIVGFLGVYVAVLFAREHYLEVAHATSPEPGDTWTIDLKEWTVATDTFGGDVADSVRNGMTVGMVRVMAVRDGHVEVAACAVTSNKDETLGDHCNTFTHELAPIATARVPSMFDRGAITKINRAGSRSPWVVTAALTFIALMWLHAWRSRRFFDAIAAGANKP